MPESDGPPTNFGSLGIINIPGVEPDPPYERRQSMGFGGECVVLQIAFEGEDADIRHGHGKYLRFGHTPMGLSLVCAAGEARRRGPRSWATFCASLKLEGCPAVAAAWSSWRATQTPTTALEGFTKAGNEEPMSADEADYWDRQIRAEIAQGIGGLAQFADAYARMTAAKRKRERRNSSKGADRFQDAITRNWLVEALWCRSTKGILDLFQFMPQTTQGDDVERSCKRIDRTISALGFAEYRRPKHELAIASVVESLTSQLRKPL